MNPLHERQRQRQRQRRLRKGAAQLGGSDDGAFAPSSSQLEVEVDWGREEADPASGDAIPTLAQALASGRCSLRMVACLPCALCRSAARGCCWVCEPLCGASRTTRSWGFWVGLTLFLFIVAAGGLALEEEGRAKANCFGTTVIMVAWWLTEAAPLAVTALLPVVLLPLLGVASASVVSSAYFSDPILLFFGSFVMAAAVQSRGLHRRFALTLLRRVGTEPRRLLLGFLTSTALLSMWLNNTATAAMMVPLSNAVLLQLKPGTGGAAGAGVGAEERRRRVHAGLCIATPMGIAYAASLGGMATLTGTGGPLRNPILEPSVLNSAIKSAIKSVMNSVAPQRQPFPTDRPVPSSRPSRPSRPSPTCTTFPSSPSPPP